MKETLDEQSRLGLMSYRMDRAYEAIGEAEVLTERGYYNAAVNRLYYACFYMTQALLLKHHIAANTHAGVKAMLGLHFVSKGLVPIELGKTFNTLFEKRHSSDYEAFAYCDKDMVEELMTLAEVFINALKELINK
jgi:uncharacterized protein (UPF0332 family)